MGKEVTGGREVTGPRQVGRACEPPVDIAPDGTAVRVALWRAMHVRVDPPPHVLEDEVGLQLVALPESWRRRGDMDPQATSRYRAGIVARARFVEDLVADHAGHGIGQYIILGAGLDTFAQRRPDLATRLRVFEVDRPGPQAWKRQRLIEHGFGVPDWLRLVPVDFESGESWWEGLRAAGFDASEPAVVASTGVSMYLTKAAKARHISAAALNQRYFAGRTDGLQTSTGEELLVATT